MRRSCRSRQGPLKWWLNERQEFGRQHQCVPAAHAASSAWLRGAGWLHLLAAYLLRMNELSQLLPLGLKCPIDAARFLAQHACCFLVLPWCRTMPTVRNVVHKVPNTPWQTVTDIRRRPAKRQRAPTPHDLDEMLGGAADEEQGWEAEEEEVVQEEQPDVEEEQEEQVADDAAEPAATEEQHEVEQQQGRRQSSRRQQAAAQPMSRRQGKAPAARVPAAKGKAMKKKAAGSKRRGRR